MASIISPLFFFIVVVGATPVVSQSSEPSEPICNDWGVSSQAAVSVVESEVGWLSCPLFSHPSVYNYSSTQNTGHNLFWYRIPEGQDLELPITYGPRLSKDREKLWLQPAVTADTGLYICMLHNKSSCSKISISLTVLQREEVLRSPNTCDLSLTGETVQDVLSLQKVHVMHCPDLQEAAKMADSEPTVSWYHATPQGKCHKYPFWNPDREQKGAALHFHTMVTSYQGLYYCTVHYQRKGKTLNFTRSINITAVYPTGLNKELIIIIPGKDQPFTVKPDSEVKLTCEAYFPYLGENTNWDIWWTVDGKTVENLPDGHRFSITKDGNSDYGDRTEKRILVIKDFESEDLKREFNCSVRNAKGFRTRRAQLVEEEVSLPSVELICCLVVTLVLMLLLFVIYHVFWLELLLLYRSWFGTDERHTDDKEYDVYISYARNSEEEQFVLSTLRSVLENELGYSVCIFDRDSLPGGTITDETLSFVARSRRVLVVVSPGYASQGSQALLELKAGIDGMARGGHLRVILVQYKPVQRQVWVRELRRARVALAMVRWNGEKSKELTSRFWKRLRVELPVRRVSRGGEEETSKEAYFMRLLSQNSTNSQTGLITNTVKEPEKVLNSAA